jgi:uncharacterized membrane-anchored protein YhcB (DUF1043 family)
MTNDELRKLKASYEYHQQRLQEEFDYTKSVIDELAKEIELRESLEESLAEAQEEILGEDDNE